MQGKLCRQKNKIFIGGTIEMQYVIPFRFFIIQYWEGCDILFLSKSLLTE